MKYGHLQSHISEPLVERTLEHVASSVLQWGVIEEEEEIKLILNFNKSRKVCRNEENLAKNF